MSEQDKKEDQLPHHSGEKFEHGKQVEPYIYNCRNKKKLKLFDVHFYLVINGKQVNRKKANIKGIQSARNILKEFQQELWQLRLRSKNGDRKWKDAKRIAYSKIADKHEKRGESSSELEDLKGILEKHTKVWDEVYLSDLVTQEIQDHVDGLKNDSGEDLALSTKIKIFGKISRVFDHNKWVKRDNPARGLKPDGWSNNQKNRKIEVGLTHEEVYRLIEHVRQKDLEWAIVISFAYFLGARSAELFALRYENIMRDKNGEPEKIHISHSWSWKKKALKKPKNGEARTVMLSEDLIALVKLIEKNKFDEFFLLPRIPAWRNGKASSVIRKYLEELKIIKPEIERNKIEKENRSASKDWFRFHDMRATMISLALDMKNPLKAVSQQVGHRSLQSTNRYLRNTEVEVQKAVVSSLGFNNLKNPQNVEEIEKHRAKKKVRQK